MLMFILEKVSSHLRIFLLAYILEEVSNINHSLTASKKASLNFSKVENQG